MHRQVVEVLSQRLQKTSGFKRAARDESPCSFSNNSSPTLYPPTSLSPTHSRSPTFSPPPSFSPLRGEKSPMSPTSTPPRKIRRKDNFVVVSEDQENGRNLEGWGEERGKGDDDRKRKVNSPGTGGSRKRMRVD